MEIVMEGLPKLRLQHRAVGKGGQRFTQAAGQHGAIREIGGSDGFARIGLGGHARAAGDDLRRDIKIGIGGRVADAVFDARCAISAVTDYAQHRTPSGRWRL